MDSSSPGQGPVSGICEQCEEHLGLVKGCGNSLSSLAPDRFSRRTSFHRVSVNFRRCLFIVSVY
jgi:hypothetical protein